MVAAVFSLVAALLYAAASVLQHRAAVTAPAERSLRLGLLGHLAVQPWWIAGIIADIGGYGAQFLALGHGPLVVVQPLLVSGLLFALPLGHALSRLRIRPVDLWGAAAVVVGLAALLLAANPGRGHGAIHSGAWLALLGSTLAGAGLLVLLALRWPSLKAPLLAAGAGVVYGLTAALTKSVAHLLHIGVGRVLGSWQLYALVAAGALGMVLAQSAFQAGPLKASLPALTVVDPLVSIAIGVTVFHERMSQDPGRVVVEVLGAAIMTLGVVILARSPLVALDEGPEERSEHAQRP